ncbi:POTRA domain-containing protein [Flavobacterium agricola]|uniref:POTRA domain-containing protein n=1 Tax=Flavobacterium agricola TaxID=2870839 RepID=UPI00293916C4|nr:POTRA domain-containing protein [Flavobacterium agricola]
MFQKAIKQFIITSILLGTVQSATAQDQNEYVAGQKYILADIDVTGKLNFNKETVVTFTGLHKGQQITVPGEEISSAIKKLWKLGLFSDVNFYITKVQNDSIYLELDINELPKLNEVKFVGIKKGKAATLTKDTDLKKGKVVNENLLTTSKNYITNKYKNDGFFNTKVNISTHPDTTENSVNMTVLVDRGKKVKISDIVFTGNENLKNGKLKGAMKNTKKKSPLNPMRIFKSSKYVPEKYKEDLVAIIDTYKENGYRDARITEENVTYNPEKKHCKS